MFFCYEHQRFVIFFLFQVGNMKLGFVIDRCWYECFRCCNDFVLQAKWCQEFGCNVWQSALSDAAAELWTCIGSHEPSCSHGVQLPACHYWKNEASAGDAGLGTSCWLCSEVTVHGCFLTVMWWCSFCSRRRTDSAWFMPQGRFLLIYSILRLASVLCQLASF